MTKRVTVEGDAIARPQNIEVPIGTLYRDVIDACGGVKEGVELGKIIFGGPMMGGAAPSADFPVLKQNNGLLLFSKRPPRCPSRPHASAAGAASRPARWVWSPSSLRRTLPTRTLLR